VSTGRPSACTVDRLGAQRTPAEYSSTTTTRKPQRRPREQSALILIHSSFEQRKTTDRYGGTRIQDGPTGTRP